MGREVRRVPLDFDWPVGAIWPGFLAGVCEKEMQLCLGYLHEKLTSEQLCTECRHAARLLGLPTGYSCPSWKRDPPAGDGWQMWETTSEGSPISPVFKTPEELAHWLADTKASAMGNSTASYESWLAMIHEGWAPSMVSDATGLHTGVDAVSQMASHHPGT